MHDDTRTKEELIDELTRVRQMERALEASERRFRTLIHALPDLILRLRADGTYVDYSPATDFDPYLPPEEFLGKTISETLPPEVAEPALAAIGRTLRTGAPQTLEYELPSDRGPRHYETRITLLDPDEVVAIVRDVTERKHAEEAATRLGRILDDSLNEIYIFAADTLRFIQVNRGARDNLGYTLDELRRLTPLDLKPEFTPESFAKLIAPLRTGEQQTVQFVTMHLRKDGTGYPVEVHLQHSTFESVPVFVAIILDRTDWQQADARWRQSEANYRSIYQHATYGIYRSRGNRFLTANPALVRMLGYESEKELLALQLDKDVYANPQRRAQLIEHFRAAQQITDIEVAWKRQDGARITVRLSGRPLYNEANELEYFEMFAEDVTQRLALEAQLRQAQKMEGIGQLTGGIAHDFNNILTVIQANTDSVRSLLPDEYPDLHAGLEELQAAARRGTALVKRLLGFSRQAMLVFQPVDLDTLMRELLATLRRLLPAGIGIEYTAERALPPINADPSAVQQIVVNLATNSRDAMPDGGRIRVATRREQLTIEHRAQRGWGEPGEYVCLVVTDDGVGMDARTREKMFEPFFTTKPQSKGTGLGLAMLYGLVKQHRGFVDVVSAPGEGTTTKVYFRLADEPVSQRLATPAGGEPTGGNETLLLAEDEAPIRRAAKRVLERYGYTVLLASNGQEALETFRRQRDHIGLVISDLEMPLMGGRDLYEAVQWEAPNTKFLFTSGYASKDETHPTDLASGGFIEKPWTVHDLLRRVREVLDQ